MGPTRWLDNEYHGSKELDSQADTTVLGHNCVILTYTGKGCKVSPYSDDYELIQYVSVVTGATVWNCPHSIEKFILLFNEALWMEDKLDHTLVNPKQMCHHRIDVQDNPCMKNPMGITCPEEDVTIPLYMSGPIVCADTSSPTQKKWDYFPWIVLKYTHGWDPHSVCFSKRSHIEE